MTPQNNDAKMSKKTKDENTAVKDDHRRDFLKTAVGAGLGVCAAGAPLCAGARLVLAPVFAQSSEGKFYPIAALDTLTEKPQKFFITDTKEDAWTKRPNQKLGSVFLRKTGDTVQAFQTLCPHAGCMIQHGVRKNPQTGNDESLFYCPCHAAHFALNGKRLDGVSPRDMDALETQVDNGKVLVKFETFSFGTAVK